MNNTLKFLIGWTVIFSVITYSILYIRVYEDAEQISMLPRMKILFFDVVNFFLAPFESKSLEEAIRTKRQLNTLLEWANDLLEDPFSPRLDRVVDFVIPFDPLSSPSLLSSLSSLLSSPPPSSSSIPLISQGEGIRVRYYKPKEERKERAGVVYVHGGGWTVGTVEGYDKVCRGIAAMTGYAVFAIDYRTAPEHPFPTPPDDVYFASRWISLHSALFHINPLHLAVVGDSAGGNMATVVSLMGLSKGEGRIFEYGFLIYPGVELVKNAERKSYKEYGERKKYLLSGEMMEWFTRQYLGTEEPATSPHLSDWKLSPILAPPSLLRSLPPTDIVLARFDPLYDEGEEYGRILHELGVDVKVTAYPAIHGFLTDLTSLPESLSLLRLLSSSLRSHFAPRK